MPKSLELQGKRFGKLLVLNFSHRRNHKKIWKCLCDCGNQVYASTSKLGSQNTKSCGCYRKALKRKPLGESAFTQIWYNYKNNCKKYGKREKKKEFYLTKKQFRNLILKNCFYCFKAPSNKCITKSGDYLHYNGLDRLNNDKAYRIDNVVPCCYECNSIKSNLFSPEETKVMVRALSQFRKNKCQK